MQIYLPTDVGTIKVSLYDHHEVLSHDLVGTSTFNPATDCGAEDVCSFTLKFRSTETVVEEVARLQGRWIRGGALRAHAEECNKRGTFVHFEEETREKSTYKLYSVKAPRLARGPELGRLREREVGLARGSPSTRPLSVFLFSEVNLLQSTYAPNG